MQINVSDESIQVVKDFMITKGMEEPTLDEVIRFYEYAALEAIKTSYNMETNFGVMLVSLLKQRTPKPTGLPPGGKCPDCGFKIVIQQDMKLRCNCKVW